MIFEAGHFIDNHHVEIKRHPAALNEPLDVFPVDDIQVSFLPECRKPLLLRSQNQTVCHAVQVIPLCDLRRPAISAYTNGGDDQGLADFKAVEHQVVQCRQRNARLA